MTPDRIEAPTGGEREPPKEPRGWRWWHPWCVCALAWGATINPIATLRGVLFTVGVLAIMIGVSDTGDRLQKWRKERAALRARAGGEG